MRVNRPGFGGGVPVRELCRQHGFSDASFYTWRAKFGGMTVPDAKRLRDLEAENAQLKKLLAESLLDAPNLEGCFRPKALTPQAKREAVAAMLEQTRISPRRACLLVDLSRTVLNYVSIRYSTMYPRCNLRMSSCRAE